MIFSTTQSNYSNKMQQQMALLSIFVYRGKSRLEFTKKLPASLRRLQLILHNNNNLMFNLLFKIIKKGKQIQIRTVGYLIFLKISRTLISSLFEWNSKNNAGADTKPSLFQLGILIFTILTSLKKKLILNYYNSLGIAELSKQYLTYICVYRSRWLD